MKRYTGEIFWIRFEQGNNKSSGSSSSTIKRAILKDNIFSIDHENPEDIPDSQIRMRSKDGYEFNGSAKYIDSPRSSAMVDFYYYYNKDKAFLRGEWREEKVVFMCLIKLDEVQQFEN